MAINDKTFVKNIAFVLNKIKGYDYQCDDAENGNTNRKSDDDLEYNHFMTIRISKNGVEIFKIVICSDGSVRFVIPENNIKKINIGKIDISKIQMVKNKKSGMLTIQKERVTKIFADTFDYLFVEF